MQVTSSQVVLMEEGRSDLGWGCTGQYDGKVVRERGRREPVLFVGEKAEDPEGFCVGAH